MRNLECAFDENLREVPANPADLQDAVNELQNHLVDEQDPDTKARVLAQLGSYQRMLKQLPAAEDSHTQCLRLLNKINADASRVIAAKIRLAHVYQWQNRFELSNPLFAECVSSSQALADNGEMKSFALQHQGKNLFDQKRYDEALKNFYEAMMIRVALNRNDLADSSRFALDRVVSLLFPSPTLERQGKILANLQVPEFVRLVNGKKQSELAETGRPNCINAVFNFFRGPPYDYKTAKTGAALDFLKTECVQIDEPTKKEIGCVVVFWSRSRGSWDDKRILLDKINPADPDFPYGLVFEHIAVFVDSEIIFHKPSPALEVPYKLDTFKSAIATLKYAKGFEMTWHLKSDA